MAKITLDLDDNVYAILQQHGMGQGMTTANYVKFVIAVYLLTKEKYPAQSELIVTLINDCASEKIKASAKSRISRRRKSIIESADEKKIFDSFISFMCETLSSSSLTYLWEYHIDKRSYTDWMDESLCIGQTIEDSRRFLNICSDTINRALLTNDETLCFEVVRMVMDWTNTYYNYSYGFNRGNETIVTHLHSNGTLLDTIRVNYDYIKNDQIEKLNYYTTGWGSVWYILDPEKMYLMSSRLVYAINNLISQFAIENYIKELPDSLDIGQLVYVGNSRYIDGIRYIYTLKGKLKMYRKIERIINSLKEVGGYRDFMAINESLFPYS